MTPEQPNLKYLDEQIDLLESLYDYLKAHARDARRLLVIARREREAMLMPPPNPDQWRSISTCSIDGLNESDIVALERAGLTTLGHLAEFWAEGLHSIQEVVGADMNAAMRISRAYSIAKLKYCPRIAESTISRGRAI